MLVPSTLNIFTFALTLVPLTCHCNPLFTVTNDSAALENGIGLGDPPRIKPVKKPDFVKCDQYYGTDLDIRQCDKAFDTMPDGYQFKVFASQRKYPGEDVAVTPVYYYDNKDNPDCVITVDMAGKSETNNRVEIRKTTLRDLYRNVKSPCLEDNHGRAGFVTYHIKRTVEGIIELSPTKDGLIDVPLFLTLQVSHKPSRKRPGNTDPKVNDALQEALEDNISHAEFGTGRKRRIQVALNSLKETRERMNEGGSQSFWDPAHITTMIPDNVDYTCREAAQDPNARNCEDASFAFIGTRSIVLDPRKAFTRQVGNCAIIVRTKEKHAVVLDVIRATIDVLIDTCIDGENAPGTGGHARAQGFSLQTSTLDAAPRSSRPFPEPTASPIPPPPPYPYKLPPTVELWVYRSNPTSIVCDAQVDNGFGAIICESSQIPEAADGGGPPPWDDLPEIPLAGASSISSGLPVASASGVIAQPGGSTATLAPAVVMPSNDETS